MNRDTGGSAFPVGVIDHYESISRDGNIHEATPVYKETPGMTLRDYFAGQVLVGIYSNKELLRTIRDLEDTSKISSKDIIAKMAGEQSDAMIKERSK